MTDDIEPAVRLLAALRLAGCLVWIDADADGDQLLCSPPTRPVQWHGDVQEAFDAWYWPLKSLVAAEHRTVH